MSSLVPILQLILAISALIILHEIGHFAAARLFKIEVEEFGIGFPPRMLRLWRRQGALQLGLLRVMIPPGIRVLRDLEPGQWVDITARQRQDGVYRLQSLRVLAAPQADRSPIRPNGDGSVQLYGELTAVQPGMLFSFNWLPLGGFVRIKGEGDPSVPGGLAAASPWVRIAVYMAGPLANLILAVGMYAFMISQVGVPTQVRIAEVSPNSPAAEAGLLPGDLIVTANQQAISEMYELRTIIYDNLGQPIDVVYQRGDQIFDTTVVPRDPPPQDGAIGIMMENIVEPISWYGALPYGLAATGNHAMALITLPAEVIKGNIAPQLARPVGYKGMYDIYQEVREQEPVEGVPASFNLIGFFTTITISLGVLNLLPIPAMDGGRILFALPEIVLRRRIPIEWQNAINLISFTALILLFLYVNLLDFTNPVQLP